MQWNRQILLHRNLNAKKTNLKNEQKNRQTSIVIETHIHTAIHKQTKKNRVNKQTKTQIYYTS
jgi:hypothetical protein